MQDKKVKILFLTLLALSLVHCQPISEGGDVATSGSEQSNTAPGGNGEIEVLANKRTASVVRSERLLSNLQSCLGVNQVSAASKQAWNDNKGSLSVEGDANSITSPMLVALAKVSAEVCNDLIQKERVLAADQRRIFNAVNFGQGPASAADTALADTVRRLARSCWGRNESDSERETLLNSTKSAFANAANNGQQTVNQMVYLCTAMTASFASFEM